MKEVVVVASSSRNTLKGLAEWHLGSLEVLQQGVLVILQWLPAPTVAFRNVCSMRRCVEEGAKGSAMEGSACPHLGCSTALVSYGPVVVGMRVVINCMPHPVSMSSVIRLYPKHAFLIKSAAGHYSNVPVFSSSYHYSHSQPHL